MDRYLFRGKRVDNGDFVTGSLNNTKNGRSLIVNCQHLEGKGKDMLLTAGYFEIIPETIGQCTCLKDKNGKLIFEGDIVNEFNKYGELFTNTIISWNKNSCSFNVYETEQIVYEITGNIHEKGES